MIPMQMIDPTPYIKLVDALNEVEALVKEAAKESDGRFSLSGVVFHGAASQKGTDLDLGGHYSIQYDSEADRWTLVSETDDAPDLCSFNQTREECSETDLCEQCYQVQVELADEMDRING
ncbi:hypothetical protein SEA_CROSBY_82 [Streptomyces phage Crosby]|nr:hypothetical protein SEA_CROSBY_82 [Streptomyces phage Crosby]